MNAFIESTDRPRPFASVRLSPREIEVLRLVAEGLTSKEAAEVLFVSKRTVDFHLLNTYGKLGVNNRVLAFRKAARLGFLPFEPTSSLPSVL